MTSIDEIMAKKRAERQKLEEGSIFVFVFAGLHLLYQKKEKKRLCFSHRCRITYAKFYAL
jgi:hypothetical protein